MLRFPVIPRDLLQEFQRVGALLSQYGLVRGSGGNLSVRIDANRIVITRHGSCLESLQEADLIIVSTDEKPPAEASMDTIIHQEIYRQTNAHAIVHAHPPHVVALSLFLEDIEPLDTEGSLIFGSVKVVEAPPGSAELAKLVANTLHNHKIVVVRAHGTYTATPTLLEGYHLTRALDYSCQVCLLAYTLFQVSKVRRILRGLISNKTGRYDWVV